MRSISTVFAAVAVAGLIVVLSTISPTVAVAISVELAKKCEAMAIKSHPPHRIGNIPYAKAERDYFNTCVANNGQMPDDPPPPPAAAKPN